MALTEEQKAKLQEKMKNSDAPFNAPKKQRHILRWVGIVLLCIVMFLCMDVMLVKKQGAWNGKSFNPLIGPKIIVTTVYQRDHYAKTGFASTSLQEFTTLFGYVCEIQDTGYVLSSERDYVLHVRWLFWDLGYYDLGHIKLEI